MAGIFAPPVSIPLHEIAEETGDRRVTRAWLTWEPTYTNLTIGNGTVVARYAEDRKTVHCYFEFTLGSTSAVGTSPLITAPVTPSTTYTVVLNTIGTARFHDDTANAGFNGFVRINTATELKPLVFNAAATHVGENNLTATVPFTWTTDDVLAFSVTYEAA